MFVKGKAIFSKIGFSRGASRSPHVRNVRIASEKLIWTLHSLVAFYKKKDNVCIQDKNEERKKVNCFEPSFLKVIMTNNICEVLEKTDECKAETVEK